MRNHDPHKQVALGFVKMIEGVEIAGVLGPLVQHPA